MKRRDFITLLGGAAAAWPLAAHAQQRGLPVVGFLNGASSAGYARYLAAFRAGLKETGFIEGQNLAVEYRWADGEYDRLPALAADLVRRQVAVIAWANSGAAQAAKAATTTIPIVFSLGADPVSLGLVASLSRPGSNLTGVANLNIELAPKRLELLRELLPTVTTIGALINPASANAEKETSDMQAAAGTLGVQLHIVHASTEGDLDMAFATLAQLRAGGLVIIPDVFFNSRTERLAALALRYALPAVYQFPEYAEAGGLMSYGGSLRDAYRLVGVYTGRILKGESPANLPVQQATKVDLIINLKTAKALGITFPLTLLGRADEVIE